MSQRSDLQKNTATRRIHVALRDADGGLALGVTFPNGGTSNQDFNLMLTHREWLLLLAKKQFSLPHGVIIRVRYWNSGEISLEISREAVFHLCLWFDDTPSWIALLENGRTEATCKDSARYINNEWKLDVPLPINRLLAGDIT